MAPTPQTLPAAGAQRGHREHPSHVLGLARRHDAPVARPMALAQLLGDDDVERRADRLLRRVPEHRLGRGVPVADRAGGIGDDDGVVSVLEQGGEGMLPDVLDGADNGSPDS
jgi:hypothetical protein